jgi:hypothetical protein
MPIPELLSDATVQFLIRFAPFSRMATARGIEYGRRSRGY